MAKSITVSFQDGSTHLYEDVPDDVTQEQVNARAAKDFPDQKIADVSHSDMSDTSLIEKIGGLSSATYNLGNQLLTSPIGHAIEAGGAALYGGNKLVEAAKAMRGIPPEAPVNAAEGAGRALGNLTKPLTAGPAAPGQIVVPENVGSGPRPMPQAPQPVAPQRPPMGFVDTNTPRMGPVAPQGPQGAQMARGMAQGAQGMAQGAQAAAQAQPQSWMSKAVQMGDQAMAKAAPVGRGIADLAARYNPALVGAQLATYSPELGPRVPQSGPYRGMEINPRTDRPWSPEELNAIAHGRY